MSRINAYSSINLLDTIELIDNLAADLTRTTKEVEDYEPDQADYVYRMNSDIAHYNEGIYALKCMIRRELLKEEEGNG